MRNGPATASRSSSPVPIPRGVTLLIACFGMASACKNTSQAPLLRSASSRLYQQLSDWPDHPCPIRRSHLIPYLYLPHCAYTHSIVSTSPTPTPQQVGILVLDDNAQGASAVKQILDTEVSGVAV